MAQLWKSPRTRTRKFVGAAVVIGTILTVAGCASPVAPAAPVASTSDANLTASEKVYAQFDAMSSGKRDAALLKAAQKEGSVVAYLRADNAADMKKAFEAKYPGVTLQVVNPGNSSAVRDQIMGQAQAGKMTADLVEAYIHELTLVYAPEDVVAKAPTFLKKLLPSPEMGYTYGLESYQWPFMIAWNTDKVTGANVPKTFKDLTKPVFQKNLVMVSGYEMQYKATFDYLTKHGMSVKDFETLFKSLASNANVQTSTNPAVQLLASGQYAAGIYLSLGSIEKAGKVPVAYDHPAATPVVLMPIGMGLTANAPHPAAALLFLQWYFTDGRKFVQQEEYVSQNPDEDRLTDATKTRLDFENLTTAEYTSWSDAYNNLLTGNGGDILPKYVQG